MQTLRPICQERSAPGFRIKTQGLLLDVNYIQVPSHIQLHEPERRHRLLADFADKQPLRIHFSHTAQVGVKYLVLLTPLTNKAAVLSPLEQRPRLAPRGDCSRNLISMSVSLSGCTFQISQDGPLQKVRP